MKKYILFNPAAGRGKGRESAEKLKDILADDELIFYDITEIKDYRALFEDIIKEDDIIICGGDGTLNRFVNDTDTLELNNNIWFFSAGTGNDFLNDLGKKNGEPPFLVNKYIKDLPVAVINGKKYKFLNAIGYGLDGYCCEEGDRQREQNKKKINYTTIAIKGLFFFYKPVNAKVTVDGKSYTFKKVWIAPAMKGRFYGGGMMAAPDQDRLAEDRKVTLVIASGSGRLKTLMFFPSIFTGEHVKRTDIVSIFTGHDITVEFDGPASLQVDGETILNVSKYSVKA